MATGVDKVEAVQAQGARRAVGMTVMGQGGVGSQRRDAVEAGLQVAGLRFAELCQPVSQAGLVGRPARGNQLSYNFV